MAATGVMALPVLEAAKGDFFPRVASAVVLAPLALAAAYLGSPIFEIALIAVAVALAWEWTRLCGSRWPRTMRVLLAFNAIVAVLAVTVGASLLIPMIIFVGAIIVGAIEGHGRRTWMAVGSVYIALPLAACEWLRDAPHGREMILWLLIVVWASDTVAYLFGRALGGPKLAPAISPKKTWSGLGGAVIGAGAAGGLVAHAQGAGDATGLAAMAALFGLAGQGGDLLESSIKRRFGVKDTSQIIPGHGGLFDRLDAFLAVVVLAAFFRLVGLLGGETW